MKMHRGGINPEGLVLHSDNGGPMKGATMRATLRLGVVPSFGRPQVSDDNLYSEALFRTMKYRAGYPSRTFSSLAAAQTWVDGYNTEHLHRGLLFGAREKLQPFLYLYKNQVMGFRTVKSNNIFFHRADMSSLFAVDDKLVSL